MKALLVQRQIATEYTHNLLRIHDELAVPEWNADEVKLEKLIGFGVASRYPGLNAEPNDVADCFSICLESP